MIRKGSLVRFTGSNRAIWPGKLLSVHDVKDKSAVVWVERDGKWTKKTVKTIELEEVVE